MENSRFKFSVIIPVYNVENYLEETIQSVIHQTIGFKKNIQIILVNDGSPDDSVRNIRGNIRITLYMLNRKMQVSVPLEITD